MNKKLIFSLLLPAALVACNNDEFVDGLAVETPAGELVENLTLNVSFDEGTDSRSAYAGSEKSLYSNFYLEPEWSTKAVKLSDNYKLYGDKLGLCLTSGANAITNLPFYIAGYGSTLAETENAQLSVYTFNTQDPESDDPEYNPLYDLGLDATTQVENDALNGDAAKDAFDDAVEALQALEGNEDLAADELDLRKAILRTNAGVMTGEYVAYYPHQEEFVDPAGIPAVELDALVEINAEMAATETAALTAVEFNDKVFAVSQSKISVDGGSKSSSLSLSPLTSLFEIELYNSVANTDNFKVKRVTVESEQGFILNGRVALNNLGTIVAEENGTTDLIGVAFTPTAINAKADKGDGKFVAIPYYPNAAVSDLVFTFYTNDGTAATVTKNDIKTANGKVIKLKVDYKELEFEKVTRKVFTATDLKAEVTAAGTLQLMDNISVADLTISKDIVIEGNNKTLTITGTSSINNKLECGEGVTLALVGTTIAADLDVDKLSLNYAAETSIAKHIKANELTIKEGSSDVTLTDAEVGTLTIEKTATLISAAAEGKEVEVGTLNNSGTLTLTAGTEEAIKVMTVTTALNNKPGATLSVPQYAELAAATVTNDAATTTPAVAAGTMTITGELNSETVNNAGSMTWSSAEAIDITLNNSGTLAINASCALTGELKNTGTVTLAESMVVAATSGTLTVDGGVVTVSGTLNFSNTGKMNINAGVVNSVGTVNGANYITVAEGAEFIRTVKDVNNFVAALGTQNIAAKFTGVRVAADIETTAELTATKKIYLSENLTLGKASTLADVEVEAAGVALTATEPATIASITIIKTAGLTVGANSFLTVTGTITNEGTYAHGAGVVVNCADATGDGTWTNNPNY